MCPLRPCGRLGVGVGAGMGLVALGGLVGASEGMWWFRGRFGVVLTEN